MAVDEKQKWAATLRAWQADCGWVAKQAAEKIGVPYGTYAAWVAAQQLPPEFVRKTVTEKLAPLYNEEMERRSRMATYAAVINKVASEIWSR